MATPATIGTARSDTAITVSCDECAVGRGPSCEDCLVTFLVAEDERRQGRVVIEAEELRAVRMLAGAGLVPALRYCKRAR